MRPIHRCLSIMAVLLLLCALASPSLRAAAKSDVGRSIGGRRAALSAVSSAGFELLGSLALGGPASAVAVQGSYAYAGVGNRLVVVNVADPAHPAPIGHVQFPDVRGDPSNIYTVAVAGRYAYSATTSSPTINPCRSAVGSTALSSLAATSTL
jgi:hypothetical protein